MEPISRHSGLETFFRADPRRSRSPELDLGAMWRDGIADESNWRLAWLETTGEVYTVDRRTGLVVVLAERLRRPVVERALAGRERQHALAWAADAVTFPRAGETWSGYMARRGPSDAWRADGGWWARPVSRDDWRWPDRARSGRNQRQWEAEALAKDILDDHLGCPPPRPVAHRFAVEVIGRRRSCASVLLLPKGDVATWAQRAAPLWHVGDLART